MFTRTFHASCCHARDEIELFAYIDLLCTLQYTGPPGVKIGATCGGEKTNMYTTEPKGAESNDTNTTTAAEAQTTETPLPPQ